MKPRRLATAFAGELANLVLMLTTVILLTATGCSSDHGAPVPAKPESGNEVVGTLVAVKDDRPADGGVDLTLETAPGTREVVHVPSIHIVPPRDVVQAMHEVVDAAKVGDRLRARGTRDEAGALRVEVLEKLPS